jgi:hypothetical protein
MTMKVTIEIRGLAHCFKKSTADEWTVCFPCDAVHDLVYSHIGLPRPIKLHQAGQDLTLKFGEGDAGVFDTNAPANGSTTTIFNLNADYAHNGRLVPHRQKVNVDEVRMFVPYSAIAGSDEGPNDYFSQVQDFAGAPVVNVGKVARLVTLSFAVNKQFDMQRFDATGAAFGSAVTIPYTEGGQITLSFNNDCGSGCTHNDALDLYEFVEDSNGRSRFAWGQILPRTPASPYGDINPLSPTYGNCDPSWSDPPVGG